MLPYDMARCAGFANNTDVCERRFTCARFTSPCGPYGSPIIASACSHSDSYIHDDSTEKQQPN
jgi:hypothetical protein